MFRFPLFAFSKRFQADCSPSSVLPDGKLGGDNQTSRRKLFSHCPLANVVKKKKLLMRFYKRLVIPGMGSDIRLEVFAGACQAQTHK